MIIERSIALAVLSLLIAGLSAPAARAQAPAFKPDVYCASQGNPKLCQQMEKDSLNNLLALWKTVPPDIFQACVAAGAGAGPGGSYAVTWLCVQQRLAPPPKQG